MKRPVLPLFVAALFAAFGLVTQAAAQVSYGDFTNSRVSYLQVTESGPAAFGAPTLSFVPPRDLLTFDPVSFYLEASFNEFELVTNSRTVQMTIKAAPGFWFYGDDCLEVKKLVAYNMQAPISQSQVSVSFGGACRLWVTEVDNKPFSADPLEEATIFSVSDSINGPGGFVSDTHECSGFLDINAIKRHFGIASSNNVTGMLLEITCTLVAGGSYASANASVTSFSVGSKTTSAPTPITNVILTVEKTTNLSGQWQFDREINVGPMTNTNEFYRLKVRTVVE